jgi:hypothetical protein
MIARPFRQATLAGALLLAALAPTTASAEVDYAPTYAQDRAEIEDLMARYLFAIDYFDWDAYVGTFAEDGKAATLRHVILQSSVRIEGDRAWARSLWVEMANHGPGDTLKMGTFGLYDDELKRVDGHWLFAKRRVLNEFIPNRHSGPENPVRQMDALAEAFLAGK